MSDHDNLDGAASPSILMLVTTFTLEDTSPNLLRELCDALAASGCRMTVCFIDWTGAHGQAVQNLALPNETEVLVVPPWRITGMGTFVSNASKWSGSALFAARELRRHFAQRRFDLILAFSPLVVSGWLIAWAKRHYRCPAYAYLTDFFPYHQQGAGQEIGGKLAFQAGLAAENWLLRQFEHIGCMSQAGREFVRRKYSLRPHQQVHLLRLWGETSLPPLRDRGAVRERHGLPIEKHIALFGGQIAEGRGIEELLEVATLARNSRPDTVFLFMGHGRLESLIADYIAAGGTNVLLKAPVSREDYLSVVSACDVGMVATVANTGVPSFPSKTIDYLRAGIPIVASVEDTTDYSAFLEENGIGVAVAAGDPGGLLQAIHDLLDDPARRSLMVERGRHALVQFFDVRRAAASILAQVSR